MLIDVLWFALMIDTGNHRRGVHFVKTLEDISGPRITFLNTTLSYDSSLVLSQSFANFYVNLFYTDWPFTNHSQLF